MARRVPRALGGKVIAITGGGRGIGRATAAALLARGARVALGDIESDLAERTAAELGSGMLGLPLDVTDRASFTAFLDQVEAHLGALDVLINNAGIMPVGRFVEEADACAERIIDINVKGVIFGSKLAIERFAPRGRGHLVNIASIAGRVGTAGGATYSASKFAVVGLSEALHQELRGTGVAVSVVIPIGTNTELYSGVTQVRGFRTPEPEDVADAIVATLERPRLEVYVPPAIGLLVRTGALLPRRAADAVSRLLGGDKALTNPDRVKRAAYEARIMRSVEPESQAGRTDEPLVR